MAPELQVAPKVESKETTELKEKLDTMHKENATLMKQFERQGEEIGILRGANETHQARVNQLITEVSDKCIEIGDQDSKIRELENKVMVAEQKAHNHE